MDSRPQLNVRFTKEDMATIDWLRERLPEAGSRVGVLRVAIYRLKARLQAEEKKRDKIPPVA